MRIKPQSTFLRATDLLYLSYPIDKLKYLKSMIKFHLLMMEVN